MVTQMVKGWLGRGGDHCEECVAAHLILAKSSYFNVTILVPFIASERATVPISPMEL